MIRRVRPIRAWRPATTCATASQIQNRSPGPRLAIHAPRPQIQPTPKIVTTTNPTSLWISVTTARILRGGDRPKDRSRTDGTVRDARVIADPSLGARVASRAGAAPRFL